MFKIVKNYYEKGIYGSAEVAKFVRVGKLTAEDYESITGEAYVN